MTVAAVRAIATVHSTGPGRLDAAERAAIWLIGSLLLANLSREIPIGNNARPMVRDAKLEAVTAIAPPATTART